jgi:hypothetical protein
VVEKVEAERTKVEEGRNQSPILWHRQHVSQYYGSVTYLALEEDCANTVEELERRNDAALDQHTCTQRCRHPPSRAYGHLVEPLLERESSHHAVPASKYVCHGVAAIMASWYLWVTLSWEDRWSGGELQLEVSTTTRRGCMAQLLAT